MGALCTKNVMIEQRITMVGFVTLNTQSREKRLRRTDGADTHTFASKKGERH